LKAAEILCIEKQQLLKTISLSAKSVTDHVVDLVKDI